MAVATATAVTLAAFFRVRRAWRDAAAPAALLLPLAAGVAVGAAGVGEAGSSIAAGLAALRAEPFLLPDPARRDTLFHLLAWPLARVAGDTAGVRAVAAAASGTALLLAYALARSAGLDRGWCLLAQALLGGVVVATVAPDHAGYTHALPQALALLLLVHLVRRFTQLEGARDTAAAFAYVVLAEAAGPVATADVALLVAMLAAAETVAGHRRRALRLATSGAAATAAVLTVRYLPALLDWPSAAAATAAATPSPSLAPLAAAVVVGALGLAALSPSTHGRRVLGAAVAAGVASLVVARSSTADGPLPGLVLLAPAASCGIAALLSRISSGRTTAAGPGSRS